MCSRPPPPTSSITVAAKTTPPRSRPRSASWLIAQAIAVVLILLFVLIRGGIGGR